MMSRERQREVVRCKIVEQGRERERNVKYETTQQERDRRRKRGEERGKVCDVYKGKSTI